VLAFIILGDTLATPIAVTLLPEVLISPLNSDIDVVDGALFVARIRPADGAPGSVNINGELTLVGACQPTPVAVCAVPCP
jgi:hypothetical protein